MRQGCVHDQRCLLCRRRLPLADHASQLAAQHGAQPQAAIDLTGEVEGFDAYFGAERTAEPSLLPLLTAALVAALPAGVPRADEITPDQEACQNKDAGDTCAATGGAGESLVAA